MNRQLALDANEQAAKPKAHETGLLPVEREALEAVNGGMGDGSVRLRTNELAIIAILIG